MKEFVFTPNEYLRHGDKEIKSLPLINTSLRGLADAGWYLGVRARFVVGYGHTKLRFHFSDPDKSGNPFLVFKFWASGNKMHGDMIELFVKHDLTPNFTKPPSFSLMPLPQYVPEMGNQEPKETELEYLQRINKEKLELLPLKFLKKPKGMTDEGWEFLQTGTH